MRRLLHHISFGVKDLQVMSAFFDAALAPLGQVHVWDGPRSVGYGLPGQGDKLLLHQTDTEVQTPAAGFHLAVGAASPEEVDRFHAAALAHGGKDNGAPGPRPGYGPNDYAAFVIDPEGWHVEAVVDLPEG